MDQSITLLLFIGVRVIYVGVEQSRWLLNFVDPLVLAAKLR